MTYVKNRGNLEAVILMVNSEVDILTRPSQIARFATTRSNAILTFAKRSFSTESRALAVESAEFPSVSVLVLIGVRNWTCCRMHLVEGDIVTSNLVRQFAHVAPSQNEIVTIVFDPQIFFGCERRNGGTFSAHVVFCT